MAKSIATGEYIELCQIFPNPVKNQINVEIPWLNRETNLSIFNTKSQKLMEKIITNQKTQIDLSKLPAGFYFIKTENGNSVETGRLIKE